MSLYLFFFYTIFALQIYVCLPGVRGFQCKESPALRLAAHRKRFEPISGAFIISLWPTVKSSYFTKIIIVCNSCKCSWKMCNDHENVAVLFYSPFIFRPREAFTAPLIKYRHPQVVGDSSSAADAALRSAAIIMTKHCLLKPLCKKYPHWGLVINMGQDSGQKLGRERSVKSQPIIQVGKILKDFK